ncbi:Flagellar hook-associated protein FliD [Rhodovulum sp. PH10]|uniref:flagellar filament capping protein FliD n=1 Tax=Rhodovulum sp. PH10 TaxID=1187851 RepID=UPI00027C250B|nr:flagellar filament capping protein FliD [Rhodovulum sp. PH10]EJW11920.1 Flagellar hook-associated protein FliD [Rhodovulum sp. PH10]
MTSVSSSTVGTSLGAAGTTVDWSGLIEAAVQQKLDKADAIDLKISDNETTIAAYGEMQSLLQDLADAANALRAPSGTSSAGDDVYLARAGYLTGVGVDDATDALAVTIEDGAALGSYDVKVLQLATAHKVASGTVESRTTDLGYAGVMRLGVGDETVDIEIDADMSLDEIAEAINNTTDDSGVQASVIKIADAQYELVLTAADTGQSIVARAVSGDDVLTSLGILDTSGGFADELQAAQQAIMTFDGVQITRDTNDVDDLIDGITFHLYETTGDGSITLEVGTDLSEVKEAIQTLVDAYNAYREFALTQQATTTAGTASDDAVLFGDGTLRNVNGQIGDALNTMVERLSIADIGLSFDSDNTLVLDEDVLDDALLDDLDGIRDLLAFDYDASSSDLMLLARGDSAPSSFTVDVTVGDDGSIASAAVGGDTSLFTISGTRIIGAAGTAYEGYTFVFVGDQSASIDVSVGQGVAERLYNVSDAAADTSDGTLQQLIDGLEDQNEALQERSDTITDRAAAYRETLTTRYASYQAKIAEAESTLSYLQALLDAEDD